MGRFAVFSTLLTTGRLALRLLRDRRVPLYAKAVPLLALLYAVSPLDFVPEEVGSVSFGADLSSVVFLWGE